MPYIYYTHIYRWQTTLDCEMLSLCDTFWVWIVGFASIATTPVLESTVLGLPYFVELLKFLQTKQNFLKSLYFSNQATLHIHQCGIHSEWRNAQCVSTPTTMILPTTVWTALVLWYTHQKLTHPKVWQNPSIYLSIYLSIYSSLP